MARKFPPLEVDQVTIMLNAGTYINVVIGSNFI